MKATIYVEGDRSLKAPMKEAFRVLFNQTPLKDRKPEVRPGDGRSQALEKFRIASLERGKHEAIFLLVDAEAPRSSKGGKWEFLRRSDGWDQPPDTTQDQVFLMVATMEAWLLSDPEGLARFYGSGFRGDVIPPVDRLESLSKANLEDILVKATAGTKKGKYRHGLQTFEALAHISPDRLRLLPHACDFLDTLQARLA